MFHSVELPFWALILILGFALVAALDWVLMPSVRWFFRRRLEKAVERLNTQLSTPIQPFKLARRHDMIQRLSYDSEVFVAMRAHAKRENIPENVAFERVQRFAREIVPAFSAAAYFGFAIRIARWISTSHFDVRISVADQAALSELSSEGTIVFVMNHRSNMDYVLVTYLVAERSALSYAVGEWARIWPLRTLIRSMGAYFIRRKSRSDLYRTVLARYVQMATSGGVTQALFPEGGLSLDGNLAPPKLGLLTYIVDGARSADQDVIFVPVALNYDRVLEDRVLVEAGEKGVRKFRASMTSILGFAGRQGWLRVTGRFKKFGKAGVSFGVPLKLSAFDGDATELGGALLRRISDVMPVLPVPLVAAALIAEDGPMTRDQITAAVRARTDTLPQDHLLSEDGPAAIAQDGLAICLRRKLVREAEDGIHIVPEQRNILTFYANSLPK